MKIEKKIRIQLFDEEGNQLSDRLLAQDTEFYSGPKEVHKGPMRVEVSLFDKDDVTNFKSYLDKVLGNLPLRAPKTTGPKIKKAELIDNREEIISHLSIMTDQDAIIKYLRSCGFVFMMSDMLTMLRFGDENSHIELKEKHLDKYQWMIKAIKIAKSPVNDKYDPNLVVGFDILNKESEFVQIYSYKKWEKKIKVGWPKKSEANFTKSELIKFPNYMTQEERMKWGIEHRLLLNNKEKKPSKFYLRWFKDVKVGNKVKIEQIGTQSE